MNVYLASKYKRKETSAQPQTQHSTPKTSPQGEITPCRRCGNVAADGHCDGYCEPCYDLEMSA